MAGNLDVLLRIEGEISRIYQVWATGNVTENMTAQLLNLTEGLSW
ncbi:hypothetical protein [Thermococcus sp. LS1]|nr:hypothetical protein [Thermococcus sp. LS1]